MRIYLVYALGILLMFAPRLRAADTTVTTGLASDFEDALTTTKDAGGGTILVTTPIQIGGTTDTSSDDFDGESIVTVSGGNTNSIFVVDGTLALANLTLANGFGTNGGAIYVTENGSLTLTSCTFSNNNVRGDDGMSADSSTNSAGDVAIGKSGGRGTAGASVSGGAIYNLGDIVVSTCTFLTNTATGGNGGDGGDGQDAGTRGGNGGSGGSGGSAFGGGIYNLGALVVSNSTFAVNVVKGGTGGIGGIGGGAIIGGLNGAGGAAGIAAGAGIYTANSNDTVLILASTFANNLADGGNSADGGTSSSGAGQNGARGGDALGGGINNSGVSLGVTNSTFFENDALGGTGGNGGVGGSRGGNGGTGGSGVGGGLFNAGSVGVLNCTFSKNAAIGGTNGTAGSGLIGGRNGKTGSSFGGNIAHLPKKKRGHTFDLMNSIIGVTLGGGSGYGTIKDDGFNISADKSIKFKKSSTSLMNTNPMVGDLADNGGPTETCALQTNSPAIDKLDPSIAPDVDQRGVSRPQPVGGLSDIGAYELDLDSARILTQPRSTNVIVGSNVTFTVTAAGTGPLFYHWLFNGAPPTLTNAANDFTNSSLVITNAQTNNAGNFQVIVSNAFNAVTSHVATLTVTSFTNFAPTITSEPVAVQTVTVGSNATLTVVATGTPPLFYQWFFEDSTFSITNLANATNATLTITNVQMANQGNYQAVITNNFGSTNSIISLLKVTTNSTTGTNGPPVP
jgi:hypothetical protein